MLRAVVSFFQLEPLTIDRYKSNICNLLLQPSIYRLCRPSAATSRHDGANLVGAAFLASS
jgi:hypothetical protein